MARNTGKPSQEIFEATFVKLGKRAFVYRVTDSAEVRGMSGAGYTKRQPSDFIVTENGAMYYAEVKSTSSRTSFSFSQIEPGQWRGARQQVAAGGDYFFFIHRKATGDWFKVPARVILDHPRKSMTWTELQPYRWELFYA